MRRFPLLVALASLLALSACTPPWSSGAGSPRAVSTSVAPAPSGAPYTTVGCADAPEPVDLVCEVHALVRDEHLDAPADDVLVTAAVEGLAELDPANADPDDDFECPLPSDDFTRLCDAFAEVGSTDLEVVEHAVRAMLAGSLDPNSTYQDAAEFDRAMENLSGQVEGIGAFVTTTDLSADEPDTARCALLSDTCVVEIVSLFEGAPAEQAGLQPGDHIVGVDGESVDGSSIDAAVERIRGPRGTDVELTVVRDGRELVIDVTRDAIDVPVIVSERVDDALYLRMGLFTSDVDERLAEVLREQLDGDVDRIVLDVRGNPGGALEAAIGVASEFMADGVVLRTESTDEDETYEVRAGGTATDPDLEVAVLVDGGSASASELVAAALQESGRATILGARTFGKDTVQQTFRLEDGGGLKLTIARWVTPNGNGFGDGLEPDVALDLPGDADPAELVRLVDEALEG